MRPADTLGPLPSGAWLLEDEGVRGLLLYCACDAREGAEVDEPENETE